nr:PAS domain-containing methyl-accepting chemotaxis protein [Xylophilus sp. ASV27]
MSTTDTQSYVTYANAAFVEVSGFTHEELRGEPHNIVRHPDMPAEAFADMWATLKGGEPWTGLVKNRRKNGDHYWVRANATPVVRNGRQVGYMSVCTRPSRAEIAEAEALYARMREGKAAGLRFYKGLVVRTGPMGWTSLLRTMPVRIRIRTAFMALLPIKLCGAWLLGLTGATLAGFACLAVSTSILASWWLELQIARPLEEVRDQALRVASGESQKAVHMGRVDEIGMALRTVSQLGLMFRWLIHDVSEQVLTVQTAVNEIASSNNHISERTEQAASSVQQTGSSMSQMTATVASNAEIATQANQLSSSATEAASMGGRAMSEVVATMSEITHSSRKIADIIGVIDAITFQTNILALNAAVEAARAGEQGRGFAVVAGEVRSLALRSAEAAKEIKGLITASVDKVVSGSRLVDDAGRTMDEIVARVKRVSDLIAEISTATAEQSDDIAQVDRAVNHLDDITQKNAALVQQTAAASASLKQQTTRLVEAVSVFR